MPSDNTARLGTATVKVLLLLFSFTAVATIPKVFYDAQQSYFAQDGTRQVFDGDVVIIAGGYVIAADHISIDRSAGVLVAQGNVLAAGEEQVLAAHTARYWFASRDFVVTDAQLVVADRSKSAQVRERMLLRGGNKDQHYARRHQFWQQSRSTATSTRQSYYLKFSSSRITRRARQFLHAERAFLTPCRCTDDEPPAFALRSHRIDAVVDQHIDFNQAVVEVKGVPVFFIPFLRLPLSRKSGLLLPHLEHRKETGFHLSQPLYLALTERSDATLYLDLLQKRGLRLAATNRGRLSAQQHWQLLAEGLHDRLGTRNAAPAWRGTLKWRGLALLAPRFSLGTEGDLNRDPHYNRSLYRNRRNEAQFSSYPYATQRLWLHADHPDFYLGAGSHLASNSEAFMTGKQLPMQFNLRSRYLQLLTLPLLTTWGQLHFVQQHIGNWHAQSIHQHAALTTINVLSNKLFDVEQFLQLEAKRLHNQRSSHLYMLQAGMRVSLPLDGQLQLDTEERRRALQHLVRVNAALIVRPQVHATGYFLRDREQFFAADQLQRGETVELELEQAWRLHEQPAVSSAQPRQQTTTPLSMRLSTAWHRQQARQRLAARRRGDTELPEAWKPLQLDVNFMHGNLSLRQKLAWNVYKQNFTQLLLELDLPLSHTVRLTPSWEISQHAVDTRASALQRVEIRRLGISTQLARNTRLQAEYADRTSLSEQRGREYRWQIGGEYRSPQQCWGLAFSRLKDWGEREHEAAYMLSLQVNFVNRQDHSGSE